MTLRQERETLPPALRQAVIENFDRATPQHQAGAAGWVIADTDLTVLNPRATDDGIAFTLQAVLHPVGQATPATSWALMQQEVDLDLTSDQIVDAFLKQPAARAKLVPVSFPGQTLFVGNGTKPTFDLMIPPTIPNSSLRLFPLRTDTFTRLTNYWRADHGFPSQVAGEFGRMVYFSAMTITTVGYGDIVPLTNRARRLTTAEAISGVVLLGFFLNALFQPRPD